MPSKHGEEFCFLSLDGGGVRGLSSLCIIEELMRKVDKDNPPKPCDYFDMIGGTSTGGLIAIMLGRLQMSIKECRAAYRELSDEAFQITNFRAAPAIKMPWNWNLKARFDTKALEKGIKRIIVRVLKKRPGNQLKSGDELVDTLLKEENPKCKVFVTATSESMPDRTTILANYVSDRWPEDLLNSTTIWQAARATSAASTFFEPIQIGPDQESFVDGATGANNPVFHIWGEASDVWKSKGPLEQNLQCLISVGTGAPTVEAFGHGLAEIANTLKSMATETETTANDFLRLYTQLHTEHRYFRFNVRSGLERVGLEDTSKRPQIVAATRRYLTSEDVKKELELCAESLGLREWLPGIWNKASQVHAAAMRVLREYVKDTKPATGQSVKWFTHFPEYRTWINGENMLCHIDFHATDKTTWLSALVSRGDLRGPTLKNTIYVDVAQYRTVNSMEAWTMVLHSLLYQYLHVHRLHIHLRSLDGLFALFHEKGHTSAHGLKRLFGKYDRVNEDHQFMIEALLRLTQDFKRDVMPVVYTVIDRIDQLDSKAGVFIVKELRKKFSCDRIMFCTRPAPAISEALEHLPTISPKTEYRYCLESLHFKEWKDRRSLVDKPLQDTNEWVWKHPSFLEWRSFATILWIKGKPGSGKSTIARMITDSLRDKNAHTSSPDSVTRGPLDYPLIADFFYSARMGERATRHSYMLRSILYQMLDQDNTLYPHFRTTYRLLLETGDGVVSWSLEHLQRVFENVVKERSSERSRICCVLDGFDESKDTDTVDTKQVIGEKTQVLSWLSGLAMSRDSQSRLTLIILSRPAAEITKYLGRFPYITVEDYNRPAILKIVDDGLCSMKNAISTWIQVDSGNYIEEEGLSQTWDDETDKALESLRRLLLERADGQILWVNLVLRELQIEFAGKGAYSPKLLEEILDSLPEGLERLYEELIRRLQRRLSSRELDRARSMLTLVCSAPRPLSLTEFRDALAMRDWKGSSSSAPFQDHLDARRIRLFQKYNWAPIERDIVDTCGCLLEVVRPASALSQPTSELRKGYIGPEFTIQTSHQTAKEFLTRGSRAQPLDIVPEQARRYISDTLLAYISASIQMPLDATIGPVIQWESGDYMMFAKYVEDRPLLPYAMEFFQKYQKDEQSSTMINQYIQELRERPEEHGWCLWRRGGRMEDTKRFIAEIEGLKRLKHRHIVEYIGGFTDSRTFCTIMSPSADVSLGAYMESKSGQLLMPEDQSLIRSFFGCLATALAHLHFSYSIRHKDISPSNILLHGSNILLTNFASSFDWTETDRSTTQDETDTITPLYAAPEVAGYGFSYSSSDIWSLGCVFLEMFAFLNSYTIEQLRTYFESHGTYGRLYHQNPLAVTELLLKLESTAQLEDRRAIPWIRDMLRVQQDERPTARRLVDNIAKSVLTSPPGFRFCGACCLSDRRKLVNSVANRQRSASDDAFR